MVIKESMEMPEQKVPRETRVLKVNRALKVQLVIPATMDK